MYVFQDQTTQQLSHLRTEPRAARTASAAGPCQTAAVKEQNKRGRANKSENRKRMGVKNPAYLSSRRVRKPFFRTRKRSRFHQHIGWSSRESMQVETHQPWHVGKRGYLWDFRDPEHRAPCKKSARSRNNSQTNYYLSLRVHIYILQPCNKTARTRKNNVKRTKKSLNSPLNE